MFELPKIYLLNVFCVIDIICDCSLLRCCIHYTIPDSILSPGIVSINWMGVFNATTGANYEFNKEHFNYFCSHRHSRLYVGIVILMQIVGILMQIAN